MPSSLLLASRGDAEVDDVELLSAELEETINARLVGESVDTANDERRVGMSCSSLDRAERGDDE